MSVSVNLKSPQHKKAGEHIMYKQYNNNQTTLTIPFEFKIPANHVATFISNFIDSIPETVLYPASSKFGRPQYSPAMMLKMIIFAYTRKTFSGRAIQQMAEENLPMMWLIGNCDDVPSYRTINRFRVAKSTEVLIKELFLQFHNQLRDYELVDDSTLFIDGTKMVADANKYSFVWRKSIEKFDTKLDEKTQTIFDELIQVNVDLAITAEDPLANLEAANQQLDEEINDLNQIIETEKVSQGGSPRKRRRRTLKHLQHIIKTDLIPRKRKYETAKAIFGDRNSFSKTDHDATFMRMKEDPMNNGQLKPGYNLQIGTQCQYVLYYMVNQQPTDQRTLQPFLKNVQKSQQTFRYVVADAGYGSESNYDFILQEFEATPLIPYTMYLKEQTRKYLKDAHKVMNWRYDHQTDSFTDDHDVHFSFKALSTRTDKYGYTRHTRVYEADAQPENKDVDYSLTKGGHQRQIRINPHWEMQKSVIRLKLSSKTGKSIYWRRKIEVESVFGNLKANLAFKRLSVRGLQSVSNELGIVLMAANLKKLAKNMGLTSQSEQECQQKVAKRTQTSSSFSYFLIRAELCPSPFLLLNRQR